MLAVSNQVISSPKQRAGLPDTIKAVDSPSSVYLGLWQISSMCRGSHLGFGRHGELTPTSCLCCLWFFVSKPDILCLLLASVKWWEDPDPSQILKLLVYLRESWCCWPNLHLPMLVLLWKEDKRGDESSNIINVWEGKKKNCLFFIGFLTISDDLLTCFMSVSSSRMQAPRSQGPFDLSLYLNE